MNVQFDEMITSPARLAILAVLLPGAPVLFSEMKAATGLADGNLHVQTKKLADAGYLDILKVRKGGRSVTEFRLTRLGFERIDLHVQKLQKILKNSARPVSPPRKRDSSAVWQ